MRVSACKGLLVTDHGAENPAFVISELFRASVQLEIQHLLFQASVQQTRPTSLIHVRQHIK